MQMSECPFLCVAGHIASADNKIMLCCSNYGIFLGRGVRGRKLCGKKEKMLVSSISLFPAMFLKDFFLRVY